MPNKRAGLGVKLHGALGNTSLTNLERNQFRMKKALLINPTKYSTYYVPNFLVLDSSIVM